LEAATMVAAAVVEAAAAAAAMVAVAVVDAMTSKVPEVKSAARHIVQTL
jgi:hypothetical protein